MSEKSIDQNIFPEVLGTARYVPLPEANELRAKECIELFPEPRGKCSGLLTDQTLNNCFITLFQLRHYFCFLITSSNMQTNVFLK